VAGSPLSYDSLAGVRRRLGEVAPHLIRYGEVEGANYFKQATELAQVLDIFQGNSLEWNFVFDKFLYLPTEIGLYCKSRYSVPFSTSQIVERETELL